MFLELLGKAQPIKEKYVYLIERCNLSCVFCWQDHNRTVDEHLMLLTLQNIFSEKVSQPTIYNIMGGEIFADFISDEMVYNFLQEDVDDKKTFNWLTNLIIDVDRFKIFLSLSPRNYIWSTSYDPCGRFTRSQQDTFVDNLLYLKYCGYIPHTISIVLTNQNIEAIINGDPIFDLLYVNDFNLFFDFLSPIPNNFQQMFPTESVIEHFFKFLVDKYPKCGPINEWLTLQPQQASCRNSQIIGFDGINSNCGNVDAKTNSKLIPLLDLGANSLQVSYIDKRNCLTCDYYQVCPLGCFLNHQVVGYMDLPDGQCGYRNVLNYIKTRNTHL